MTSARHTWPGPAYQPATVSLGATCSRVHTHCARGVLSGLAEAHRIRPQEPQAPSQWMGAAQGQLSGKLPRARDFLRCWPRAALVRQLLTVSVTPDEPCPAGGPPTPIPGMVSSHGRHCGLCLLGSLIHCAPDPAAPPRLCTSRPWVLAGSSFVGWQPPAQPPPALHPASPSPRPCISLPLPAPPTGTERQRRPPGSASTQCYTTPPWTDTRGHMDRHDRISEGSLAQKAAGSSPTKRPGQEAERCGQD